MKERGRWVLYFWSSLSLCCSSWEAYGWEISEAMLGVGSLLIRFIWEPEIAKLDILLPVSARRPGESSNGLLEMDSLKPWRLGTDWCSETCGSCEEGLELRPEPEVFGVFFELEAFWARLEFDAFGMTLELRLRTCTDDGWSETDNFSKLRTWNTEGFQ